MSSLIRQSTRFAIVGLLNTAIGLAAIYAVMYFFRTGPAFANAVGYAIGLVISFSLNRTWTFQNDRPVTWVLPRYLLVTTLSYLLNLGAVLWVIFQSGANPYLAQLIGVCIYTVCVFIGCRCFVFVQPKTAS
jgi:putative flippase GtrA